MLQHLVSTYFKRRNKRIEAVWLNADEVQQKTLRYLLNKGSKTVYGKKYNFKSIDNYTAFRLNILGRTNKEL